MASSPPSRVAPSRRRCAVWGRWPMAVDISGRVSASLTGRFTVRAASTVKTVCGQVRSPAPNPAAQVRDERPHVLLRHREERREGRPRLRQPLG